MLRRRLLAVLATLTMVLAFIPLWACAEASAYETSPPARTEVPEQAEELPVGNAPEEPDEDDVDEKVADDEPATEEEPGKDNPEKDNSGDLVQYTVTIHYIDEKGNKLRDDYIGQYAPGSAFAIESPAIKGYTPDFDKITSGEGGMPGEAREYTVTYSKTVIPAEPAPPPDAKADKAAPRAPAAAAITERDTRSYELTVVGEEKIPLSAGFLDTECCVLHLLLMLLATAVLIWYTKDMKQHQKHILELEDQLDLH